MDPYDVKFDNNWTKLFKAYSGGYKQLSAFQNVFADDVGIVRYLKPIDDKTLSSDKN